jgi:hypothetical protein
MFHKITTTQIVFLWLSAIPLIPSLAMRDYILCSRVEWHLLTIGFGHLYLYIYSLWFIFALIDIITIYKLYRSRPKNCTTYMLGNSDELSYYVRFKWNYSLITLLLGVLSIDIYFFYYIAPVALILDVIYCINYVGYIRPLIAGLLKVEVSLALSGWLI